VLLILVYVLVHSLDNKTIILNYEFNIIVLLSNDSLLNQINVLEFTEPPFSSVFDSQLSELTTTFSKLRTVFFKFV